MRERFVVLHARACASVCVCLKSTAVVGKETNHPLAQQHCWWQVHVKPHAALARHPQAAVERTFSDAVVDGRDNGSSMAWWPSCPPSVALTGDSVTSGQCQAQRSLGKKMPSARNERKIANLLRDWHCKQRSHMLTSPSNLWIQGNKRCTRTHTRRYIRIRPYTCSEAKRLG